MIYDYTCLISLISVQSPRRGILSSSRASPLRLPLLSHYEVHSGHPPSVLFRHSSPLFRFPHPSHSFKRHTRSQPQGRFGGIEPRTSFRHTARRLMNLSAVPGGNSRDDIPFTADIVTVEDSAPTEPLLSEMLGSRLDHGIWARRRIGHPKHTDAPPTSPSDPPIASSSTTESSSTNSTSLPPSTSSPPPPPPSSSTHNSAAPPHPTSSSRSASLSSSSLSTHSSSASSSASPTAPSFSSSPPSASTLPTSPSFLSSSPSSPTPDLSSSSSTPILAAASARSNLVPALAGTLVPLFLLALLGAFILHRRRRRLHEETQAHSPDEGSPDEEWLRQASAPQTPASTGAGRGEGGRDSPWNGSDVLFLGPDSAEKGPAPEKHSPLGFGYDGDAGTSWISLRSDVLLLGSHENTQAQAPSVSARTRSPSPSPSPSSSRSPSPSPSPSPFPGSPVRERHDAEEEEEEQEVGATDTDTPPTSPAAHEHGQDLTLSRAPTFATFDSDDRTPPTPLPRYARPLPKIPFMNNNK
ncbi:hypothetical protein B0H19DRAFT_284264 [Mycena capillaripes]|nr:hypothetical protein B0H19DRAFT_284264 [Mycena capillaripes]